MKLKGILLLAHIDIFFWSRLERLGKRLQRLVGLDVFHVFQAAAVIQAATMLYDASVNSGGWLWLCTAYMIGTNAWQFKHLAPKLRERAYKRAEEQTMNVDKVIIPLLIGRAVMTSIQISVCILMLGRVAKERPTVAGLGCWIIFWAMAIILGEATACDVDVPSASKLKQWLSKLSFQPALQPIPVSNN